MTGTACVRCSTQRLRAITGTDPQAAPLHSGVPCGEHCYLTECFDDRNSPLPTRATPDSGLWDPTEQVLVARLVFVTNGNPCAIARMLPTAHTCADVYRLDPHQINVWRKYMTQQGLVLGSTKTVPTAPVSQVLEKYDAHKDVRRCLWRPPCPFASPQRS